MTFRLAMWYSSCVFSISAIFADGLLWALLMLGWAICMFALFADWLGRGNG